MIPPEPPPPPPVRLPGYDGAMGPASPAETTKVDAAVSQIHHDLSDQGFLGHDRNDHMHDIVNVLNGLSPQERDAVISQLSDSDLKSFGGNADHGGIAGLQGLDSGEKQDLFNTLATSLSGVQLARVAQGFHDAGDVDKLSQAIAGFSTNDVKAEFVRAEAPHTTDQSLGKTDTPVLSGTLIAQDGDPDAKAVGVVLGSLQYDSANFDKAVNSLNDTQLGAVVAASAGQENLTISTGEGIPVQTNDFRPQVLTGILNAAATSFDPKVKARIVALAGSEVSTINGSNHLFDPNPTASQSAQQVADGITKVLRSDTTGVVRQLEINDPDGRGLAGYAQQELRSTSGQKTLGGFVATLQTGPAHDQSPTAYIQQKTASGEYANAHSLGYFSGAVQAGVSRLDASREAQADMLGNIFSTVVGVFSDKAGDLGGKAIDFLTEQAVDEAKSDYLNGGGDLADTWDRLAYPTDKATGEPYHGPAQDSYRTNELWVIEHAS